jgi:hypothetical protein
MIFLQNVSNRAGKSWQEQSRSIGSLTVAGAWPPAPSKQLRKVTCRVKWELHLATAIGGLYIATHRGVQLGIGLASDAVRHYGGAHG